MSVGGLSAWKRKLNRILFTRIGLRWLSTQMANWWLSPFIYTIGNIFICILVHSMQIAFRVKLQIYWKLNKAKRMGVNQWHWPSICHSLPHFIIDVYITMCRIEWQSKQKKPTIMTTIRAMIIRIQMWSFCHHRRHCLHCYQVSIKEINI